MSLGFKTHLRKLNQPDFLIAVIVILPFFFGALIELLGIPSSIKYLLDIAWITLFILIIINLCKRTFAPSKRVWIIFLWPICFFVYTLIVYIFYYQSALYFFWGVRNNFRFFVFVAAVIVFLKKEDIKRYFKLFDSLFWINFVVCLFQYFVLGKEQDFLGGIFGVEQGGNGYINVFFVIVIIKSSVCYLNKCESFLSFFLKSAAVNLVAAMAELKFFFVEYAIILVFAVLLSRFTVRKLLFVFVGIVALIIGIRVVTLLFPEFENFASIRSMLALATAGGYGYAEALNRFSAIPIISKGYLTTGLKRAFGLGLGNCDTSAYEFLNTPFYEQHFNLRYNWFSTAFTYLETGFVGLMFYFGYFVLVYFVALRKNKSQSIVTAEDKTYSSIAAITAVMCCVLIIYNSSMRTEAAYMAYFMLALPFIEDKKMIDRKV